MPVQNNTSFIDGANEMMDRFLKAMPEITVQDECKKINQAYNGDTHLYIKESFSRYLNQSLTVRIK